MVELTDRLLTGADRDLVRALQRREKTEFEAIYLKTEVAELGEFNDRVEATLEGKLDQPRQTFDRVLVAVGRRPNSRDIGLETTQVQIEEGMTKIVFASTPNAFRNRGRSRRGLYRQRDPYSGGKKTGAAIRRSCRLYAPARRCGKTPQRYLRSKEPAIPAKRVITIRPNPTNMTII
jgi:hypothetical protein